jgi:hypothetical protein
MILNIHNYLIGGGLLQPILGYNGEVYTGASPQGAKVAILLIAWLNR